MSKNLIKTIRNVIVSVSDRLSDRDIENAYSLLENDEWGEALSLICTQLYEYDVAVDKATLDQIDLAGRHMNMDQKLWEVLETTEQ